MKAFFKHMLEQPFVMATGVAALAHSTWALATLFSGKEPAQFTTAWWAWLIPALLIAFALDVGQIVTSSEIRGGQRTITKYFTFGVFAIATYFLQWLYIIHHIPALELSEGVRGEWHNVVLLLRDCAIWIIPLLLPLSTLLYTFSRNRSKGKNNRRRRNLTYKNHPICPCSKGNHRTKSNSITHCSKRVICHRCPSKRRI